MKPFRLLLCALLLIAAFPLAMQAGEPVRVACVGNSITYGTGLAHREREAYPAQLQALLGEGYLVGSFGKPGATLLRRAFRPYFDQEEFRQAMAFRADIAVIHLGVNDTDPRAWPNYRDEFTGDYLALIDSLRKVNPQVRVLVAAITPIGDRHPRFQSGTKEWQDQVRASIADVARIAGAELIDFHTPLYAYPWLLPDAIHPNAEGAAILARTAYSGITGDYGGLSMAPTYTDHMVLQRRTPLHIAGRDDAGRSVRVRLMRGKKVLAKGTATANNRGEWSVELPAQEAAERLTLCIESTLDKKGSGDAKKKTLTYADVAVGEVWLCSGQSNMAFRLEQSVDAGEIAADAALRLFDMKEYWPTDASTWPAAAIDSVRHLRYFRPTQWQPSTPESARRFSAVAWHFGRMLRDSLDVPVGLICNAVGGSTTESWIPRQTLETCLPKILDRWLHNDYIQDWCRGRAAQNLGLNLNEVTDDFRHRHPYEPCYLFEAGILPLGPYDIKGAIWYQGESNAHNTEAHERLFPLLVEAWREYFNQPAMPFYFVQLSSLNRPSWPWFRDSQRRLAEVIPHTGFAVTTDVGDSLDVHPRRKQPVGRRLARLALHDTYGMQHVTAGGPLPVSAAISNKGKVKVSFERADGLRTADGRAPQTFEVAEYEGRYFPARATIQGNAIVLECPEVKRPRFVRYGWQPFTRANVINGDDLPMTTSRISVE